MPKQRESSFLYDRSKGRLFTYTVGLVNYLWCAVVKTLETEPTVPYS